MRQALEARNKPMKGSSRFFSVLPFFICNSFWYSWRGTAGIDEVDTPKYFTVNFFFSLGGLPMVSQSEIYNGYDCGACRTQPRDLGACTPQIQPLMSRLTAVVTQVVNEDSGGEAMQSRTPSSREAARLPGLQRPRSRGRDAEREIADPFGGLLRSGPFVCCIQAPVGWHLRC